MQISRITSTVRLLLAFLIGLACLSGCTSSKPHRPAPRATPPSRDGSTWVTIRSGSFQAPPSAPPCVMVTSDTFSLDTATPRSEALPSTATDEPEPEASPVAKGEPIHTEVVTTGDSLVVGRPAIISFVGDGDTVTVRFDGEKKGKIARLYGIDAPELKQTFGAESRDFLNELALGKHCLVDVLQPGTYGRLIALLHLDDGTCLNLALVEAGWAWSRHFGRPNEDAPDPTPETKRRMRVWQDRIAAAMENARTERLGLWASKDPLMPWRHRARKSTGKTTVYATRYGTRFHRTACPSLKGGADALTLKEAQHRGLEPCKLCNPLAEDEE